jgi:DNA-binding transcriptional ArsR family regulator
MQGMTSTLRSPHEQRPNINYRYGGKREMTQQTEARIEQLPSSAKAVFSLLGDGKPRTLNEMVGSVAFSPRTIRNALNRLRESGLIIAKFNFRDARKPLYQLKVA